LVQESSTEVASPLGSHLHAAVSSHRSVPRAIAAEDTILMQKSSLKTASLPVWYFPNWCLLVMGRKKRISMPLEQEFFKKGNVKRRRGQESTL